MRITLYMRILLAAACVNLAGLTAALAREPDASAPQLVQQTLLPNFVKEDWRGSSFSSDGRLLLVTDKERSFFVDVENGHELRAVKMEHGEHLIWARPALKGYRWIAATNHTRLVRIDASTGVPEPIADLAPRLRDASYVSETISFELVSDEELVAFVTILRERPEGTGTYRWDDQSILSLDLRSGAVTAWTAVTDDQFFTNLRGRLVLNRKAELVGVFDPRSPAPVTIWRKAPGSPSARPGFELACSLPQHVAENYVVALVPYEQGFLAFRKKGEVTYLGREQFDSPGCLRDADASERITGCQWTLGAGPVVTAATGRTEEEFILVRRPLDLAIARISRAGCSSTVSPLADLKEHYPPLQLAKALNIQTSLDSVEVDGADFVVQAIPGQQRLVVIAGGAIVRARAGARAELVLSLLGNPTGAYEIEASPGLVLGAQLIAPLRAFDLESLTVRTIEYDYATYFDKAWFYSKPYAIARGIGAVATLAYDGRLTFHAAASGVDAAGLPKPEKLPIATPSGICISDDGTQLFVTSGHKVLHLFRRVRGVMKEVARLDLGAGLDPPKIACDGGGALAIVTDTLTDKVFVVDVRGTSLILKQTLLVGGSSKLLARPSLSRDGRLLGIGSRLLVRASRNALFGEAKTQLKAERLAFSDDGKQMMAFGERSALYRLRHGARGLDMVAVRDDFGPARDGAFLDAAHILLVRESEALEIVSKANAPVGRLAFGGKTDWVFADASGHFDVSDIERHAPGYWLMPDDPLRALPPEIFMRDYYEPRLLSRLMECNRKDAGGGCAEIRPVRPLASLNRVQPRVEIVSVTPEAGEPEQVAVTVRVTSAEGREGAQAGRKSGVYDLRLFRAGQLVGQHPVTQIDEPLGMGTVEDELARWRDAHRILADGSTEIHFPGIRLPGGVQSESVTFSAYAFNDDRVKSGNAVLPYVRPSTWQGRRRAYLIAVGVSAYQTPDWDLRYADNDARRLLEVLEPRLRATGRYERVVPINIASSWTKVGEGRRIDRADATKDNIRAVLRVLSGAMQAGDLPVGLAAGLEKATPDDLVVLLFSSHGYSDEAGNFFLFPYDIGTTNGRKINVDVLKRAISSAELSLWLRGVDAGDIVMIVDACHSAASVEGTGFKPGPMGSRGLGQLAYDKGMRILASTRADDLAWESPDIRQGLLSYALVHQGLEQGAADFRPTDGRIGVGEWLVFGSEQVPRLYVAAKQARNVKLGARLMAFDPDTRLPRRVEVGGKDVMGRIQRPALFDYRRGADPLLIRR